MDTHQRRTLAIRVSQSIAHDHGILNAVPRILKDTNHTIVHLWPSPIVAKVSTDKRFRLRSTSLDKEVSIAGLLAASGAPVVQPATSFPPRSHHVDGVELTFWNYYEADETRPILSEELGKTLRAVHDTLDNLRNSLPILPSFKLQLDEVDELLRRPASVPQLPTADRDFLLSLYRAVVEAIGNKVFENRPLHGECGPHQTISTSTGLVWLDFEAACLGPREWDLAGLDRQAVESYGTVDLSLLSLLKTARLLCIVTWCWTQPDRDPEIREAAGYHLNYLKRRAKIDPR